MTSYIAHSTGAVVGSVQGLLSSLKLASPSRAPASPSSRRTQSLSSPSPASGSSPSKMIENATQTDAGPLSLLVPEPAAPPPVFKANLTGIRGRGISVHTRVPPTSPQANVTFDRDLVWGVTSPRQPASPAAAVPKEADEAPSAAVLDRRASREGRSAPGALSSAAGGTRTVGGFVGVLDADKSREQAAEPLAAPVLPPGAAQEKEKRPMLRSEPPQPPPLLSKVDPRKEIEELKRAAAHGTNEQKELVGNVSEWMSVGHSHKAKKPGVQASEGVTYAQLANEGMENLMGKGV